jgi:hypothetical protein
MKIIVALWIKFGSGIREHSARLQYREQGELASIWWNLNHLPLTARTQILSVTCDNASNNDTMCSELENLLPKFSTTNHTRCFTHIINLIAKSMLKQFDVAKKTAMDDDLSDEEWEILNLATGIDDEERAMMEESDPDDDDLEADDDLEGWVDEVDALTEEERAALQEEIQPVSRVLVKVCVTYMGLHLVINLFDTFSSESSPSRWSTLLRPCYLHGKRSWKSTIWRSR